MASYLYAVQDNQGRELTSAHVDVEKVGDITAVVGEDEVTLVFEDVPVTSGRIRDSDQRPLRLCRWPSDDKLADPVCHEIS